MSSPLKIKTEKGLMLIDEKTILYIEAFNKHSIIYLNNLNKIEANHSLKKMESDLLKPTFFRIHNSFIINCSYFECIKKQKIVLKGNTCVPFSRFKKQLFEINMEKYYSLIETLALTSK
ncbi:MAG: LytTR family transcriptional regulator [Bacteroidetes bacterium]|nr:LytTR family transcriptional regulator [Bacteroidota bacterium]